MKTHIPVLKTLTPPREKLTRSLNMLTTRSECVCTRLEAFQESF